MLKEPIIMQLYSSVVLFFLELHFKLGYQHFDENVDAAGFSKKNAVNQHPQFKSSHCAGLQTLE